ncbi:MAG TPA: class I SAM-dependent methyltransferase [Candidatus Binataceae bacterium]|nr:class I SAM-dependent methyltransferase [Candidatus Binataceae bacterium]
MVAAVLAHRAVSGGVLIDVGCGAGSLWSHVEQSFDRYIGVDAVRYDSFPPAATFYPANLNAGMPAVPNNLGDVVVAVETIEHLENPRALMRELVRVAKPGGWVIVTTPNQLSLNSIGCLLLKHRFAYFQDVHYPAHLTALLEIDLIRIARESGLADPRIDYSGSGRIPFTPWHYPPFLSAVFARSFSDNLALVGRKPL